MFYQTVIVEFNVINSWKLLKECGFKPKEKWNELGNKFKIIAITIIISYYIHCRYISWYSIG